MRSSQNLLLSSLLLLPTLTTSLPALEATSPSSSSSSSSPSSLPTKDVYKFKNGTWIENLTMRPNSDILFTLFTPGQHGGQVYALPNPASPHPQAVHLANITSIDTILGIERVITEGDGNGDEVYFTVGSKSTGVTAPVPGTHGGFIFTLPGAQGSHRDEDNDSEGRKQTEYGYGNVKVQQVASFPQAGFLNGVANLPLLPNVLLIADSINGTVGRFNVATGQYEPHAFQFPEMNPNPASGIPLGVNGIHVRDSYLYFSNSGTASIFRVAATGDAYPAPGAKPELVSDLSTVSSFVDDFTLDKQGNIWAVTNPGNTLIFVDTKTGKGKVVAGSKNSLALAGATAVRFGTGKTDGDVAYVTIDGGLAAPVNGTLTRGGAVVAVQTK